ncbi:MAG: 4Fe-4S dicluster domain-containing protein [Prevotellaceae bacterium]|jgi:heterodisulfide reductase subunit C|nr:4Fe-4S dicluster domain-containing protein [Prevotellaceae bacterium]
MSSEQKGFTAEIRSATGVNVNRCYQCGKCSAGCALSEDMDYPPSVVMRLLQTNSAESYHKILRSQAIWLCASCQNCVTRCPMQIDLPQLMDYLRVQALEKKAVNTKSKKIVAFHRAFLDSVRYTGRLYEVGLVADYKLRTLDLLQDLSVAPRMLLKGKLPLLPEMVKGKLKIRS